jgi:CheY-like chemotaxis protein
MARASSVAQTGQTVRPFATAVRKLAFAGRSCGNCGSPEIRPSKSRNALDIVLACLFLTPFRCRVCRERFYRFWRPSLLRNPDPPIAPPIAPLIVMPSWNAVPNVDPLAPPWIEPEALQSPRLQPRLIPPARKQGTVTSAFIERLEAGLRSPRSLPDTPRDILILESDLSIRKLLRRLLERRGYRAVEIERMGDLQAQLENHSLADLLVIDVAASDAPDVKALVALARAHPGLKILALSVEAPEANEIPKRLVMLPKPFSLDRFVQCVDRLLEK